MEMTVHEHIAQIIVQELMGFAWFHLVYAIAMVTLQDLIVLIAQADSKGNIVMNLLVHMIVQVMDFALHHSLAIVKLVMLVSSVNPQIVTKIVPTVEIVLQEFVVAGMDGKDLIVMFRFALEDLLLVHLEKFVLVMVVVLMQIDVNVTKDGLAMIVQNLIVIINAMVTVNVLLKVFVFAMKDGKEVHVLIVFVQVVAQVMVFACLIILPLHQRNIYESTNLKKLVLINLLLLIQKTHSFTTQLSLC